jgi:hypothetical protein
VSDVHDTHGAGLAHDGHDAAPSAAPARPTLEELKERKAKSRRHPARDGEVMTISMGPQHPSMHGVYRAELDLDGEVIVAVRPEIGNLHRGVEKLCEERNYHQIIPLTDRLDYISGFAMNHGFCEAAEKLMGVEVPARGRYIRTIAHELCRLSNHIMWLGIHIMDLGTQTFFCICFRDREYVLDLLEMLTGARLTHSFARIGGVAKDLPDGTTASTTSGPRAWAFSPPRTATPGGSPVRRCVRPGWRATCARTILTRPTTRWTSKWRWNTTPMCTTVSWCA